MTRPPTVLSRPQKLYVVCAAVFVTALVVAEATASKFFTAAALPTPVTILGVEFTSVVMTAGAIAFPVTFVGRAMIVFEFALLQVAMAVPTASISPVPGAAFDTVFGATGRIILGSLSSSRGLL